MKLLAKTFAGLEDVLADEIRQLGGENVVPTKRGVLYEGDQRLLYRSNYELRTALRIQVLINTFRAKNEADLYKKMREIEWWQYMDLRQTFAIDAITKSTIFTHSHFVGLKTKDAIADQFRDKMNRRPDVDTERPDCRINVHVHEDEVSVSLDASGDSLHKRRYRQTQAVAPLNEVLAAGMIKLSAWTGATDFADAMCGSGTLLTEAALLATNTPPQYLREYFCCKRWLDFDENLWKEVVENAASAKTPITKRIFGADLSSRALLAAKENIQAIGFKSQITLDKGDFFARKGPHTEGGILVMNPPYDERLKLENAIDFHKKLGDAMKQNWKGWTVWILSGNLEAAKFIGLRPTRRIHLFNGALECRFLKFEVY